MIYDVFIRDPHQYGGGFEIRISAVANEYAAKVEALKAANAEGEATYDMADIGSVKEFVAPSADDMDLSDGLGLR